MEQETRKGKDADPAKLGSKLGWLKIHATEIVPIIVAVVTEAINIACGKP
jgi:hypothetical protein